MSQLLDYAPRVKWHRRRRRAIVLLVLIVGLLAGAYFQRQWLARHWRLTVLSYRQWRCLHHTDSPETVVYEEDPAASAGLLKRSGYVALPTGQVIRPGADWIDWLSDVKREYGTRATSRLDEHSGATVFLHERSTPSGQKLLVHCVYYVGWRGGPSGIFVLLIKPGSGATPPTYAGGSHSGDTYWFPPLSTVYERLIPHPEKHHLRIFAGQVDPNNASRFWFDYAIDGNRGRTWVHIMDPPKGSASKGPRVDREPVWEGLPH